MTQTRFVGLDPSTKTGFVALDEEGNVLKAKELTGVGDKDPKRMVTLVDEIMSHLQSDDVICIESPAMHAKGRSVGFMWGLAYAIRLSLFRRKLNYFDVAPPAVKKFATGKGNTKKEDMILPLSKKWGFEHSSDNVRDAYVLSRIAMAMYSYNPQEISLTNDLTAYQLEVLAAIKKPA